MSLAVGVATSSKGMGLDDGEEGNPVSETKHNPEPETEDEDEDDAEAKIQLGPQCTLKELSEKDKDDESLRRWKEQLLGSVDMNSVGDSNDLGQSSQKDGGRRSWTPEEDDYLLHALKEMAVTGWKSDNGFRAGYLRHLERLLRQKFPHANIKATPHIHSKLTTWKKLYGPVLTLLGRSGIGFNLHGDFKIECDPEYLKEVLRKDASAAKIIGKSYPNLKRWMEVFGKDRATGTTADDMMEMVNELIADKEVEVTEGTPQGTPLTSTPLNTTPLNSTPLNSTAAEDSVCQSQSNEVHSLPSAHKKRKPQGQDHIQNLCELLSVMHQDTNARLQNLGDRLGVQADLLKAKNDVCALLQEIPNLSEDDLFDIGDILMEKTSNLQMFLTLPESKRASYVYRLLKMKK